MELTATEKMLFELLQEKETEAQRQAQQRVRRFLDGISERTGIPVDVLGINPQTGVITDARIAAADRATPEVNGLVETSADDCVDKDVDDVVGEEH